MKSVLLRSIFWMFNTIFHTNAGKDSSLGNKDCLRICLGIATKSAKQRQNRSIHHMSGTVYDVCQMRYDVVEITHKMGMRIRRMERGMSACWTVLSM